MTTIDPNAVPILDALRVAEAGGEPDLTKVNKADWLGRAGYLADLGLVELKRTAGGLELSADGSRWMLPAFSIHLTDEGRAEALRLACLAKMTDLVRPPAPTPGPPSGPSPAGASPGI